MSVFVHSSEVSAKNFVIRSSTKEPSAADKNSPIYNANTMALCDAVQHLTCATFLQLHRKLMYVYAQFSDIVSYLQVYENLILNYLRSFCVVN